MELWLKIDDTITHVIKPGIAHFPLKEPFIVPETGRYVLSIEDGFGVVTPVGGADEERALRLP